MYKVTLCIIILCTFCFAGAHCLDLAEMKLYKNLRGDEYINAQQPIPVLTDRGPGDTIGSTAYEFQENGSFGQRLYVDDSMQAHIDWMWNDYPGQNQRYCAWNARFSDGSYYGETQVSPSWSGYVQLDVTRDPGIDNQRTICAYHYDAGAGYYGWIDIDQGNLWGTWPYNPRTPAIADHIWPYVCAAENGNIVMATGDYASGADHHLYLTTDEGGTWSNVGDIDSCGTLSQFLRSSRNSDKVVHTWTQYIELIGTNDQLNNDVYYMLSTDGGATWGSPVNITNYIPYSSITDTATWAYCNTHAVFDNNDNLHIAWGGYQAHVDAGTLYVLDRAKIFHWDEVSQNISVVSSPSTYYNEPGGWWVDYYDRAGVWRTVCDQPELVIDEDSDTIFCLWHGQADTTDYSSGGYFNGDLYGAYSVDNGATWSLYRNLTDSHTPGGAPGQCADEDYMTANPFVVRDSIIVTYIDDKDAGGYAQGEGALTENPVMCWVFSTEMITGIKEVNNNSVSSSYMNISPNPTNGMFVLEYSLNHNAYVDVRVYDATGRMVKNPAKGYNAAGFHTKSMDMSGLPNGTYFIVLDAEDLCTAQSFVIMR